MSELNLDYFGKLISDTDRLAKLYKHIESLEQRVKELDSVIDSNKRDWVTRSKSLHSKIKALEQKLESRELKLKEAEESIDAFKRFFSGSKDLTIDDITKIAHICEMGCRFDSAKCNKECEHCKSMNKSTRSDLVTFCPICGREIT